MSKFLYAVLFLTGMLVSAMPALAGDNNLRETRDITFHGRIAAGTCNVTNPETVDLGNTIKETFLLPAVTPVMFQSPSVLTAVLLKSARPPSPSPARPIPKTRPMARSFMPIR